MPEAFVLETLRTARAKATMLAGWGNVPGVTINRFCASGIDAEAQAETLAALERAFVRQGADGQDGLALAAHPEAGEIRHLHTVGTSPALADAAALVLTAGQTAVEKAAGLGVAGLIGRVAS